MLTSKQRSYLRGLSHDLSDIVLVGKDGVYDIQKVNVSTTYYRDRNRTYVNGTSQEQWNTCNNQGLLNSGWVFTGEKQEVK